MKVRKSQDKQKNYPVTKGARPKQIVFLADTSTKGVGTGGGPPAAKKVFFTQNKTTRNPGTVQKRIANSDGRTDGLT